MRSIITFLVSAFMFLTSTQALARMQALSESEMSSVYAQTDLAAGLISLLQNKAATGQAITGEELFSSLQILSKSFGVSFEDISIMGERNGSLSVMVSQNGEVIGVSQLPSHFDRIVIGAVRVGSGASMGSLSIENVNISGQLKVSVH
ncbi:hypothetical protein [Bdellovibrio sp. NC01]|uniref:hypothetical protein n=1 Tax=Bdellovibrio sp. NC01 TaxID=2220073 RepID=UPI001158E6DB|nr:hypothetical protein [Bdellovibrio sp. NC01]QDK37773.1 hypothetical protein DOE51_09345 [Bdellovibrio sp. NC01]